MSLGSALDDFARAMGSMAYPSASLEAAADAALLRKRVFSSLPDIHAKVIVLRYFSAPAPREVSLARTVSEQQQIIVLRRAKESAAHDIAKRIKAQPRKRTAKSYDLKLIEAVCLAWGGHRPPPHRDTWADTCRKSTFYAVCHAVEAALDQLLDDAGKEYEKRSLKNEERA